MEINQPTGAAVLSGVRMDQGIGSINRLLESRGDEVAIGVSAGVNMPIVHKLFSNVRFG